MAKDSVLLEIKVTTAGTTKAYKDTLQLSKATDQAEKSQKNLGRTQDKYNRLQKGTAELGMNTTKSFSKMQQSVDGGGGAGGLVRAYALLAANVFALTAAFGVLSRSAQIDTLVESMEILSTSGGTYIKNLARDMQEASGFAIDLAQAFSQVSLASSAGLSTKEIEGLTTVAKGAAISLGRNLPDAMDRIFRGAIKLEPEILDEIGLFVRVDEAAQKYARNNGKVVSSLTQVEKRQAFLNEILEQGTRKFEEYAEAIKPDPYVRLGAALQDIAQEGLSLTNSVLGPVLGFLAESKTLLTIVFGALVTVLLKKAIPAMGLMTKSAAELAQERAAEAKAYSDSITENSNAAINAEKKTLQETRKSLRDRTREQERFVSRSKKPGADTTKLDKAALGSKQRAARVQERIVVLEKAQIKAKGKNKLLIDQELNALREEERIEQRLANLKTTTGVREGSLADMRQKKLDSDARVSGAVSMAAGTMETQGIAEGFRELNTELKTQVEVNGKLEDKYTKTEKAKARLKGGVSGLGVAFNKLMMYLGPIMMAFAVLSPFLIAAAKAMGFMSAEAKAFDETLKKLNDQLEKYDKRLEKQIQGMKSFTLTFREIVKANMAFNKNIADTTQRTLDTIAAFKEWDKVAKPIVKWWDKVMFFKPEGQGRKEWATLTAGTKQLKETVQALVEAGDTKVLEELFGKEMTERVINYDTRLQEATTTRKAIMTAMRQESKDIYEYNSTLSNLNAELNKVKGKDIKSHLDLPEDVTKDWNVLEKAYFDLNNELSTTWRKINFVGMEMKDLEKASRTLNLATEYQAQLFEILGSAMDGAAESVGKFQNQFLPKTKVDDILSSMDAMDAALDKMDDRWRESFWQSFADDDNPFKEIFSKVQREMLEINHTMEDGTKLQFDWLESLAWEEVKRQLNDYKESVLKLAQETKELTNQNKRLNEVIDAGREIRERINSQQNTIMRNNAQIAEMTLEIMGRTWGLTKDQTRGLVEQLIIEEKLVKNADQRTEFDKRLLEFGLDFNKLLALRGALHNADTELLEEQLHLQTETERLELTRLKTLEKVVKAQRSAVDASMKLLKTQAKLTALTTRGTKTLTPKQESDLKIKTAGKTFSIALLEAKLKKAMIKAEYKLLERKLFVLGMETNDPSLVEKVTTEGEFGTEFTYKLKDSLKQNLGEATELMDNAMDDIIKNIKDNFIVESADAISKGFEGGVGMGLIAARKTYIDGVAALQKELDEGKIGGDDFEKKKGELEQIMRMTSLREATDKYAESLRKLGPEGELIATVIEGTWALRDAFVDMNAVLDTKGVGSLEKMGAVASFAGQVFQQIGSMIVANAKAQTHALDQQIKMEKARDGKSQESLSKIAAMEKKKTSIAKKAFEQNKKMQIASAIMSTAGAVAGAYNLPPTPGAPWNVAFAALMAALGMAQVAIIRKQQFTGGSGDAPAPKTALSIGQRSNRVDVSRGVSGGELGYLRGERGVGMANAFTPTGGAGGLRKGYAAGTGEEDLLVGERGPEIVTARGPYEVIPNDALGGGASNVNFTINAVDAAGVEDVLLRQRGNIIGMLRDAANDSGERFLESVDTDVVGVA